MKNMIANAKAEAEKKEATKDFIPEVEEGRGGRKQEIPKEKKNREAKVRYFWEVQPLPNKAKTPSLKHPTVAAVYNVWDESRIDVFLA